MTKTEINEERINNIIGKNIKRYRLLYNANVGSLTQKDLASLIGVSVSLIGGLESSKVYKGISVLNLYKISKILNVPMEKFLENE